MAEAPTIWVLECPFRKDGSPVLGTFGATVRRVVVVEAEEWRRLCELHPALLTQSFRVGHEGPPE